MDNESNYITGIGVVNSNCGFDELCQFEEKLYRYMFSRRRKGSQYPFPIRTRCTANPGGIGHDWVKRTFIDPATAKRGTLFIPASLDDNPGLNAREYRESLMELDPVTRAQLMHGDWNVRPEGLLFKREWFKDKILDELPNKRLRRIRYWDLAATKVDPKKGNDPDFCSGCAMASDDDNNVYVYDMQHFRDTPLATEERIQTTAQIDGRNVTIRIEQEPGASSKLYIATLAQRLLSGYDCGPFPTNGLDKVTRAKPFSAACQRGSVYIVRGSWVSEWLDEVCAFPIVAHDDQVDATTGGYNALFAEPELRTGRGYYGSADIQQDRAARFAVGPKW